MEHLEYPDEGIWSARRKWFEQAMEPANGLAGYIVSEQACALVADVQASFCVGAWVAVIILAAAVVDAAIREAEIPNFTGTAKQLLDAAEVDKEFHELRTRRNALVHVDAKNPALTVDDQWYRRGELADEARRAVELMSRAFYMSPWV